MAQPSSAQTEEPSEDFSGQGIRPAARAASYRARFAKPHDATAARIPRRAPAWLLLSSVQQIQRISRIVHEVDTVSRIKHQTKERTRPRG
jgi:hypothetical protein